VDINGAACARSGVAVSAPAAAPAAVALMRLRRLMSMTWLDLSDGVSGWKRRSKT
jgi:hypothetical protein